LVGTEKQLILHDQLYALLRVCSHSLSNISAQAFLSLGDKSLFFSLRSPLRGVKGNGYGVAGFHQKRETPLRCTSYCIFRNTYKSAIQLTLYCIFRYDLGIDLKYQQSTSSDCRPSASSEELNYIIFSTKHQAITLKTHILATLSPCWGWYRVD